MATWQGLQQFLKSRILLAFAEHLDIDRSDAHRAAGLDAIARFPAGGDAVQGALDGGFVVAERLQRVPDVAFGVAVQPAQLGFLRRGFAGEAVDVQKRQDVIAQRLIQSLDQHGQRAGRQPGLVVGAGTGCSWAPSGAANSQRPQSNSRQILEERLEPASWQIGDRWNHDGGDSIVRTKRESRLENRDGVSRYCCVYNRFITIGEVGKRQTP